MAEARKLESREGHSLLPCTGSAHLPIVPPAVMTAISMTPCIVIAVASSIESRAINIMVHHPPHDRRAVPIDHRTIDIAVHDAANDRPVVNMANNDRPPIAIVVPAIISEAIMPSSMSRCSSEATQHEGGYHGDEFELARHEQFPRKVDCSLGTGSGVNSL